MIGEIFDQFLRWTGRRWIFEGGSLRFCFSKRFSDLAINIMVIDYGSFSFEEIILWRFRILREIFFIVFSESQFWRVFSRCWRRSFNIGIITPRRIIPVRCFFSGSCSRQFRLEVELVQHPALLSIESIVSSLMNLSTRLSTKLTCDVSSLVKKSKSSFFFVVRCRLMNRVTLVVGVLNLVTRSLWLLLKSKLVRTRQSELYCRSQSQHKRYSSVFLVPLRSLEYQVCGDLGVWTTYS